MERGALYYMLFGAAVVAVPALVDRLLKGRVTDRWRVALVLVAAALVGVIGALIARLPGV
jgi:hypothetical protein